MIKNFLDINDFNKVELRKILYLAKKIKSNPHKYKSELQNKYLGLLFEKESTRTRLSFSIGMQKLGGGVIELDNTKIGFGTRETEKDILKTLSQYIDVLMIRNNDHVKLKRIASLNSLPIINGLTNFSHPCQILSDIFTIEECIGKIEKKTIAWLGDFNNVLISLIHVAEIFKFKLNIMTPQSMITISKKYLSNDKLKYTTFINDVELGLKNAHCVMTDVSTSMGEKKVKNKKNLLKKFQVNNEIMKKANKKAIFMHCLPAHRNEEVTDSVIDGKQSVVWQQAQNRMYVQQSILCYLINYVN